MSMSVLTFWDAVNAMTKEQWEAVESIASHKRRTDWEKAAEIASDAASTKSGEAWKTRTAARLLAAEAAVKAGAGGDAMNAVSAVAWATNELQAEQEGNYFLPMFRIVLRLDGQIRS